MTGGLLEQGLTRGTTAGQAPPRGPVRRRSRRVLGVLAPLALRAARKDADAFAHRIKVAVEAG